MGRIIEILHDNWLFHLGDAKNAQFIDFYDKEWQILSLPHDWSINGQYVKSREDNKVKSDDKGLKIKKDMDLYMGYPLVLDHRIGYLPQGIGWYRKKLFIPKFYENKKILILFDGIYRNSEVWINGIYIGYRPYGYVSFCYELTPFIEFGAENILAIKVNNKGVSNRWYTGSGIYRKVSLIIVDKIHIKNWGTYWTTPIVNRKKATIHLETIVINDFAKKKIPIRLISDIIFNGIIEKSQITEFEISSGENYIKQIFEIVNPKLWSPDSPKVYRIRTRIERNNEILDEFWTPLGLRSFRFDPDLGFFLNEKRMKIKGVCLHHDNGCLGSAVHKRAIERKLEILKEMGCNAIRTSHNPPSVELLDFCDTMGFLVMDEAFDEWTLPKTPYGYWNHFDKWHVQDLKDFIHRDRNHPSVIIWSCGNEVPEQHNPDGESLETLRKLLGIFHSEDPSRSVTHGCDQIDQANHTGFCNMLDLVGYNYKGDIITGSATNEYKFRCRYDDEHKIYPKRLIIGSENCSSLNTRGVYHFPIENQAQYSDDYAVSSYDIKSEIPLIILKTRPYVSGLFAWEGFDYLGEPTPFIWPAKSSQFGILDLCGFPKDTYYLYKSMWTEKPMVHFLPHWNWHEGMNIPVWVYSNCESVELFLNGNSLGEKYFEKNDPEVLHLEWNVDYLPGEMRAVAKKNGVEMAIKVIKTSKAPHHLKIEADKKVIKIEGDLVFLKVSVHDIDGNIVPDSHNLINFVIKGEGSLIGVGNGNPISHESFLDRIRHVFNGLCLGVVKSTNTPGEITVKVASAGLKSASIMIKSHNHATLAEFLENK